MTSVPASQPARSNTRSVAWTVILALFAAGVFVLPYHVAVSPALSESYLFGYNNRVGQAVIALAACALLLVAPQLSFRPVRDRSSVEPLPRRLLYWSLALSGLLAVLLYLATRSGEGFSESIYLVDRVKLVLEHRVPYRDFEYVYGPLFVYGPTAFAAVLHVSAGDGYGLFWIVATLAGVGLLFWTVSVAEGSLRARRAVFLLAFAVTAALPLSTGLNYSTVRYIVPCALALALLRRWRALRADSSFAATALSVTLLPFLAFCLALSISPEFAISFGLGVTAFQLVRRPSWRARVVHGSLVTGSVVLMLVMSWAAADLGVFRTLADFRSGGFNFPISPSPLVLILLLALGLCTLYAGQQMSQPDADEPVLLLAAVSAGSMAAALGRCDIVHTLMAPFGIFLAAALVLAERPTLWRWYAAAVLILFVVIPVPFAVYGTGVDLSRLWLKQIVAGERLDRLSARDRWILARMTGAMGESRAREKFNNYKTFANMPPDVDPLAAFQLPAGTVFAAPFGFTPSRFGTYHSPQIDTGYFFENFNIVTPRAVQQKISELAAHPERPLLLLPNFEGLCVTDPPRNRQALTAATLYPYRRKAVNLDNILQPFCGYVHARYRVALPATAERFGYELWVPRP